MIEVRNFKLADLEPLALATAHDNHVLIRPTHVLIDNGEFRGYASVGVVPTVIFWVDSKNGNGRCVSKLWRTVNEELLVNGATMALFPCQVDSPLRGLLKNRSHASFNNVEMFIRKI